MKAKHPRPSDVLRRAIRDSGLSAYAIAKASGVDKAALSRFMAGRVGLAMQSLDKLAPVLGLELTARKSNARKGKGR